MASTAFAYSKIIMMTTGFNYHLFEKNEHWAIIIALRARTICYLITSSRQLTMDEVRCTIVETFYNITDKEVVG